jgi:hypothetical protein
MSRKLAPMPPGYVATAERLPDLIERWCALEPGLPDLRWLDPGDTVFVGSIASPEACRYLADSPDAFRLLAWLSEQTKGEATLLMVTVALQMLGHLPARAHLASSVELHSQRMPEQPCPECGAPLDAVSSARGGKDPPNAGDVSICIQCGTLLEFNNDISSRKLSPEAFAALPHEYRETLRRMQAHQRDIVARRVTAKTRPDA